MTRKPFEKDTLRKKTDGERALGTEKERWKRKRDSNTQTHRERG